MIANHRAAKRRRIFGISAAATETDLGSDILKGVNRIAKNTTRQAGFRNHDWRHQSEKHYERRWHSGDLDGELLFDIKNKKHGHWQKTTRLMVWVLAIVLTLIDMTTTWELLNVYPNIHSSHLQWILMLKNEKAKLDSVMTWKPPARCLGLSKTMKNALAKSKM